MTYPGCDPRRVCVHGNPLNGPCPHCQKPDWRDTELGKLFPSDWSDEEFNEAIQELIEAGYVEQHPTEESWRITEAGQKALFDHDDKN